MIWIKSNYLHNISRCDNFCYLFVSQHLFLAKFSGGDQNKEQRLVNYLNLKRRIYIVLLKRVLVISEVHISVYFPHWKQPQNKSAPIKNQEPTVSHLFRSR